MFSRKQLLFVGSVLLGCFQVDATRIVNIINKTNEPKISNSNLDLTLVTVDGKTKFPLGTFKSSTIDLDQYEIAKKNPVKLLVKVIKGIRLPQGGTTNAPSSTSDVLIPGVTYNILSSRDEMSANTIYLFINLEKK